MQSISYGSKTRPLDGISWRPTSWRTFTRLSRTIRTPSPAFPSCASSWSCIAGAFSFISGTSPESDAVGPDPVQGHVEYAVPIGDRGRVRLDRLGQLDLAVEDPSIGVSGVDREPMLRRGEFQRLAGCAPEFHGNVDPRGVDDDLGGGLPGQPALVCDRQRRTERERACASHRRETLVCTETPDDAVNGIGGATLPLAGRFRDHGDHRGPARGPSELLAVAPIAAFAALAAARGSS